tara:strand:- start:522 stop:713 length:192 start_codon:yes stop_codon:yes gene_type:complete
MESLIQFVEDQAWFNWACAVIAAASAFSALTPTPKEGSVLAKVYSVIDFLAVNFGKAKDKGAK